MAPRFDRTRRAREVVSVARRRKLVRVLRELGVAGNRPATREGAVEFRRALEELGTTFLKLGQLLSSRPDLLPDVYIEALSKLVDEVPPFPSAEAEQVVREDLGDAVVELDPEPIAAASIAQIHGALLPDGREAVVKTPSRDRRGGRPRPGARPLSRRVRREALGDGRAAAAARARR